MVSSLSVFQVRFTQQPGNCVTVSAYSNSAISPAFREKWKVLTDILGKFIKTWDFQTEKAKRSSPASSPECFLFFKLLFCLASIEEKNTSLTLKASVREIYWSIFNRGHSAWFLNPCYWPATKSISKIICMLFPFITAAGKVQYHGKLTGTCKAHQTHPTAQASRQCPTAGFAPRDRFTKPPVTAAQDGNSKFDQKRRRDQRFNKMHDKCSAPWVTANRVSTIMLNPVARIVPRMETMGHMGKSNIALSLKLSIVWEQSKPHPNTSGIDI